MKKSYTLSAIRLMLKILPIAFWTVLIFAFDKPYVAILTLLSALIHELGHISALILLSKKYRFFGVASGFRLSANGGLSYKEELVVAIFGPLVNIILFLLTRHSPPFSFSHYARTFGLINLFTAISNLIPIESYDGYRIAECIINEYCPDAISSSFLHAVSFVFSSTLCLAALYLIRSFNGGYWIFFIFLASLVKAIAKDTSVF